MMAADDPVPPVTSSPVDDAPALPPVPRPATPASSFIAPTPPTGVAAEEQLAPGVQRAQLEGDGASEPRSVGVRATVHDAAMHGSGIARAIEVAHRGQDARTINQQLGGAAAAAASGQAAQIQLPRASDEPEDLPSIDPLAAPARIGDGEERRRRQEHETELASAAEDAADDQDQV